jgi:tetratricopeptide (TPR) repeat protein
MKIGDCLAKKESYIEALLNYKEALNLSKTHQVHAKVALMFELKNEWSKAIEHYQAALALIPDTPLEAITRRSHLLAIGRL